MKFGRHSCTICSRYNPILIVPIIEEIYDLLGAFLYLCHGRKAAITNLCVYDCLIYSPDNFKLGDVLEPFTYS